MLVAGLLYPVTPTVTRALTDGQEDIDIDDAPYYERALQAAALEVTSTGAQIGGKSHHSLNDQTAGYLPVR